MIIIKDTETLLKELTVKFQSVFGKTVSISPSDYIGMTVAIFSDILSTSNSFADVVQKSLQFNNAGDQDLDLLLANFNFKRQEGRARVPNVDLTGTANTTIPQGSRAETTDNKIFYSISDVILDAQGKGSVDFLSETLDNDLSIKSGELNKILSVVSGWTSVNNANDSINGVFENDTQFRIRYLNSLNKYSIGYLGTLKSSLLAVNGVLDVFVKQNETETTESAPFNLPAHQVYTIIDYRDTSIENMLFNTIFNNLPPVLTFANNNAYKKSQNVNDIQGYPHTVMFEKCTEKSLIISFELKKSDNVSETEKTELINALLQYINFDKRKINILLVYTEVLCVLVNIANGNYKIENFYMSVANNPPIATDNVDIQFDYNQVPVLTENNILINEIP